MQLQEEVEYRKKSGEVVDPEYISSRVAHIEKEAAEQEKDALAIYGMLEGSDPHIAPLRRALAVWGLTADDIGALSIHGTSTAANVRNFFVGFLPSLTFVIGGERDPYLERHIHDHFEVSRQCSSYHCAKESCWPLQGWRCGLASPGYCRRSTQVSFLETATASKPCSVNTIVCLLLTAISQ